MTSKTFLVVLCITLFFISCTPVQQPSSETIKKEITQVIGDFYTKYKNEDIAFVDYYRNDVIRIGTDGKPVMGNKSFREKWEQRIQDDNFDLLSYGKPEVIVGKEQVVSYNTFDEIFINPESKDTSRATGTWIAV
ncbi:hypothetical protein [Fodinibius saliphilus]|uniref:hypothetical protein n=1 Tax=Fodinibius saliphilus TaxID=1920650 RepID=UPI00110971FC|nr:hypothetical protein [Fodinibius saliphilus]